MPRPALPLLLLATAVAASACGSPGGGEADDGGALEVVASTSVYADVVEAVGGDHVEVDAIIDRTSQDPHSYEATAQDKLALSKADLAVYNGGGYDVFIEQLAGDLDLGPDRLLAAVGHAEAGHAAEGSPEDPAGGTGAAESGGAHAGEGAHDDPAGGTGAAESGDAHAGHDHAAGNEHVWYDVHTMGALAGAVAERLGDLRPEAAAEFDANAAAFTAEVDGLAGRLEALAAAADGRKFAMTEPVPYYLLVEAGLSDGTPEGFSAAIESGTDAPPVLVKELNDALAAGELAVLAHNPQTSGPQTEAIVRSAEDAGVPVVEFTETLPEGRDYVSWMASNLDALEDALGR